MTLFGLLPVGLPPYDDQVVVYVINLFSRTNRMDLALNILDEAIDHRPDNHLFLWGRGLILRKMGKLHEAIESFKAALELKPDEWRASQKSTLI